MGIVFTIDKETRELQREEGYCRGVGEGEKQRDRMIKRWSNTDVITAFHISAVAKLNNCIVVKMKIRPSYFLKSRWKYKACTGKQVELSCPIAVCLPFSCISPLCERQRIYNCRAPRQHQSKTATEPTHGLLTL